VVWLPPSLLSVSSRKKIDAITARVAYDSIGNPGLLFLSFLKRVRR
jgi:hypothetical protein